MPLLDMSDVLTDPDFTDCLVCMRNAQVIDDNGRGTLVPTPFPFYGIVTSEGGDELKRLAEGEIISQKIRIISKFLLTDGGIGFTADIVQWNGATYTVRQVDDYSRYGQGFTQATCELIPLSGG